MRKKLFVAALLATTAMWPTQAYAMPPVVAFIGGLVGAIVSAAGAVVSGIGAIAGGLGLGGAFGGALGTALLSAGLSLGISYLRSLLAPKQNPQQPSIVRIVNTRQPISYFEFAYGVVRKGGPIAFWKAKGGRRYYDVLLAAHEINRIVTHQFDERQVEINEDGWAYSPPYGNGSPTHDGWQHAKVEPYLGAPGQSAPAHLAANFPQITAAHNFDGLAHVALSVRNVAQEAFSQMYPTGREPVYTAVLEGKKVYDPRDPTQDANEPSTHKFSSNAALIIADWCVSPDGLGKAVDWDAVAIEADAADVVVLDRSGNPQPKWRLAGTYTANDPRDQVRANMCVACDAFTFENADGSVGFNVGRWIEPTVTFSDSDILSIRISEGQDGPNVANAMVVEYTEAEYGYREAAAAPYVIAAPAETYTEDSLSTYWVPNHLQAVMIEKRLLKASRAKYKISMQLKYEGRRLRGQRTFNLAFTEGGITHAFEVDKFTRGDDGITWQVDAHSVEPADFEFNAVVEEPLKPARIGFEVDDSLPAPQNVSASVVHVAGSVAIRVEFDPLPRDSLMSQMRYRKVGGGWTTISVPIGQYHQNIVGVEDNATYDIQVRSITATGNASKWVPNSGGNEDMPTLSINVVADPTPPVALVTPGAVDGTGQFSANFGTTNDSHLAAVAIYRTASGAPLNRGTDLASRPAVAPGVSYSVPITVPAGTYDIYMEPVNLSLVAGPLAGPFAVTVA